MPYRIAATQVHRWQWCRPSGTYTINDHSTIFASMTFSPELLVHEWCLVIYLRTPNSSFRVKWKYFMPESAVSSDDKMCWVKRSICKQNVELAIEFDAPGSGSCHTSLHHDIVGTMRIHSSGWREASWMAAAHMNMNTVRPSRYSSEYQKYSLLMKYGKWLDIEMKNIRKWHSFYNQMMTDKTHLNMFNSWKHTK